MKLKIYFRLLVFIVALGSITAQNMEQTIPVPTPEDTEQGISVSDDAEQNIAALSLSQFNFAAASVLPIYKNTSGHTIVILAREAYGKDKGTYDDFGGKRDPGENHPEITAGREGWEELILGKTGPVDLNSFMNYINVDSNNTEYVIARISKKSVVYITDFSPYWNNIRKTFYLARRNARQHQYKEKDHLVVVPWDQLQNVIAQSQPGQTVTMYAYGINENGEYATESTLITLRPFLVAKLRSFFQDQLSNQKIRFYE